MQNTLQTINDNMKKMIKQKYPGLVSSKAIVYNEKKVIWTFTLYTFVDLISNMYFNSVFRKVEN